MSGKVGGGGGSGAAIEVFPDLHHKMSKKIAQLTKVIYHLNTKNEDHAVEVEQIQANHAQEIQQILRDATNRIAKFKENIENKQQAAAQDKLIASLQKKYDSDKANAQQELSVLRQKHIERENKIANEFASKYTNLQKDIDEMNAKFIEKLQSLETINANLKNSLENSLNNSKLGNEELRNKYELEIDALIKSSNEKYQAMLIEQIGIQENLKKDLEGKYENEMKVMNERFKADMERELGECSSFIS